MQSSNIPVAHSTEIEFLCSWSTSSTAKDRWAVNCTTRKPNSNSLFCHFSHFLYNHSLLYYIDRIVKVTLSIRNSIQYLYSVCTSSYMVHSIVCTRIYVQNDNVKWRDVLSVIKPYRFPKGCVTACTVHLHGHRKSPYLIHV